MAFIDSTIVNVAMPALQSTLHATVVDVQWVIESYGLFLSALILVGGALGDSVGRRAMFLLGIVGFALASVGCGFFFDDQNSVDMALSSGDCRGPLWCRAVWLSSVHASTNNPGQSNRDVGRIHNHHNCSRSGPRRMVD